MIKYLRHLYCMWTESNIWDVNYMSGKVWCKHCGTVSKKNYYHKTISEKY